MTASYFIDRYSKKLRLACASDAVQQWLSDLEGGRTIRGHCVLKAFQTEHSGEIDRDQSDLTCRLHPFLNPCDLALSTIALNLITTCASRSSDADEEKVCSVMAGLIDRYQLSDMR